MFDIIFQISIKYNDQNNFLGCRLHRGVVTDYVMVTDYTVVLSVITVVTVGYTSSTFIHSVAKSQQKIMIML